MTTDGACCDLSGLCARAGVVEVGADEPLLATEPGGIQVLTRSTSAHVIGPYYAVGAAGVRLTNDVLVVLGNPTEPLHGYVDHDVLLELASCIEANLED